MKALFFTALMALSLSARAEDVGGHPVETCTPTKCTILFDFQTAADPTSILYVKPVASGPLQATLEILGQPGFSQPMTATVFLCPTLQNQEPAQFSCELLTRSFPLNESVRVAAANYIIVYGDSQSNLVTVPINGKAEVRLAAIKVPPVFSHEGFGHVDRVSVSRNLSASDEQAKTLLGLYSLKINANVLKLCTSSALSNESLKACGRFKSNHGYRDFLGPIITFDLPRQVMVIQNIQTDSKEEADFSSVGVIMTDVVSELDSSSFVSVFPGSYEVLYSDDGGIVYRRNQTTVQ